MDEKNSNGIISEIRLEYKSGLEATTLSTGRVGHYIGSGFGIAKGKINGKVKWDLFEKNEEKLCEVNLVGIIETDDNAIINFDALGLFLKPEEGPKWKLAAGVTFDTKDEKYLWLNQAIAIWRGSFDSGTYKHHYKVLLVEPQNV